MKIDFGNTALGQFLDSSDKDQTTTTTNDPWWGAIGPLLQYYKRVKEFGKSTDPTVADISPETQAAWGLQTGRALSGSPVTQAAQQNAYNTLSGSMLMPSFNAQFQPMAQQLGETFRDYTVPGIQSTFSLAGRTGSGAQQNALAGAEGQFGRSLASLAGDIYGKERGYQMQAMGLAPQLAMQDYLDIGQLGKVGAEKTAYQQQLLDAPFKKLAQEGSLLQPGLGFGTSTTKAPLQENKMGDILSLLSLASMFA